MEKRTEYSRNNLLHIWHSTIRDLKNIGAKFFHPQFCVGGIKYVLLAYFFTLSLSLTHSSLYNNTVT